MGVTFNLGWDRHIIHHPLVSVTHCFCSVKQTTGKKRELAFILYLCSARFFLDLYILLYCILFCCFGFFFGGGLY